MPEQLPTGLEDLQGLDLSWPNHSDTLRPTGSDGGIELADRARGEHLRMAGYKQAACLLAERLGERSFADESLLYPFAMCWRHHLELQLKTLIADSAELYSESQPDELAKTHSLGRLWGWAKPYILRTFPDDESADPRVPDRIIGQFANIDPDGAAFRYARRADGSSTVPRKTPIEVTPFHSALLNLSAYLDGAIEGTAWLFDQQPDWRDSV